MESVTNTCQYIMGAMMQVTALLAPPLPPTWNGSGYPSQGDLLDLLNLNLGPPVNVLQVSSIQIGTAYLLEGGLDGLVGPFHPIIRASNLRSSTYSPAPCGQQGSQ